MTRFVLAALGLALFVGLGASVAQAADSPDLRTIGIDAFPLFGQHQPATIGDFSGQVGLAFFSSDKGGKGFGHFEADMRFMQGAAKNELTGVTRNGTWGLT
jgi:hypothetical protein